VAEFRYKAFISYSHQDEKWARWLHRALESYRVPRRLVGKPGRTGDIPARINPVFRDRDDLSAARDLSKRIAQALGNSESLIIICSPSAAQSRWVNEEIRQFQSLGDSNRIYCLIVDGDPQPEPADRSCFPPALFEGSEQRRFEPLAADARKWADGKRLAKLKIVTALLGVRLDELRQRDLQRRRRLMVLAGLGLMAALALVVMTVTSQISRQQEHENAERMATFIVELGEKLQSDTDLETLALITAEASRHFQKLDPDKLTAETGKKVALTLRQMGRVSELQGRPEEASEHYLQSYDILSRLRKSSPDIPELIFELGNAEYYVGNLYLQQGDYQWAREAFQNYHELTRELLETDPDNPDWIMERSYSHNNLAALQLNSGMGVDEATLTHLEEAIGLIERAMRLAPDDEAYASHYANTLAWAADAQYEACNLDKAMSLQIKARDMAEDSVRSDPGNSNLKRLYAYATSGLATLQVDTGKLELAEENLNLAILMLEQLSAADPSNVLYPWEAIHRQFRLARLIAERDRLSEAKTLMLELEPKMIPASEPGDHQEDSRIAHIDFLLACASIESRLGNTREASDRLLAVLEAGSANPDRQDRNHADSVRLLETRFRWWELHGNDGLDRFPTVPKSSLGTAGALRSCEDAQYAAKLHVLENDRSKAASEVGYLTERGYKDPAFLRFCRKYELCASLSR